MSLRKFIQRNETPIILALIVLLGLFLRFYHLGFQSFWLDELNSAIESDPSFRDHGLLFYLGGVEQQPPIFFLIGQFFISLFGNTEAVLRLSPAIMGTCSILALYGVGKELGGKRLGLYAATLLSVNFFGILYSQEARPYTLVLFFSLLSWMFLLKFFKNQSIRNLVLYIVFSILMLYSNYFGLFVMVIQVVVALAYTYTDIVQPKKFLLWLGLGGVIIGLAFVPWLPYLGNASSIKSTWIPLPEENFAIDYFFGYFGYSGLLLPFILLFLLSYFVHLFLSLRSEEKSIKNRPLVFIFVTCLIWIFVGLFIPYIRSHRVVPMLVPRYTITILPAFLLILAAGLNAIGSRLIRLMLVSIFCLLSLTHLYVTQYYKNPRKTQFRELAQYMSSDTSNMYRVITKYTGWQQTYYLKKNHYTSYVTDGFDRDLQLDSILNLKKAAGPFWLTGAHHEEVPNKRLYQSLDSSYFIFKQVQLFDCWGQLFLPKNYFGDSSIVIAAASLPDSLVVLQGNERLLPVPPTGMRTSTFLLKPGKYSLIVVAKGPQEKKAEQTLKCYEDTDALGVFPLSKLQQARTYSFEIQHTKVVSFFFEPDPKGTQPEGSTNSNVFVQTIIIKPEH